MSPVEPLIYAVSGIGFWNVVSLLPIPELGVFDDAAEGLVRYGDEGAEAVEGFFDSRKITAGPTRREIADLPQQNIIRETAEKESRYVYRGLAEGEDISKGLSARSPHAGNTPASHVAGKKKTQWISTTKSKKVAIEKYRKNGVVKIDLTNVTEKVVDVSNGLPGKKGMLSNWAKKDKEVLVRNYIPKEAIKKNK